VGDNNGSFHVVEPLATLHCTSPITRVLGVGVIPPVERRLVAMAAFSQSRNVLERLARDGGGQTGESSENNGKSHHADQKALIVFAVTET
jgi:hypothetical protein